MPTQLPDPAVVQLAGQFLIAHRDWGVRSALSSLERMAGLVTDRHKAAAYLLAWERLRAIQGDGTGSVGDAIARQAK